MWAEVSSSAPHLLHSGLSDTPIRWRCLLTVSCPVRRPVTALDCVLLKERNLALAPRQGSEINSRACQWVSPRPRYHIQFWLTNQLLILPVESLPRPDQVRETIEQSCLLRAYRGFHYIVPLLCVRKGINMHHCNKSYIGQTSRSLILRFQERTRCVKHNEPQNCLLRAHRRFHYIVPQLCVRKILNFSSGAVSLFARMFTS